MKNIFQSVHEIKNGLPQGKTLTLIGGAFDLIHVGHIHLIEYANTLEDILVVAVLSDKSIHDYKGSMRPIINERQRALMVASMRVVDFVYISEVGPSNSKTLELLRPDSVVFGEEDSNAENVRRWITRIGNYSPNTKINLLPRYNEEIVSTSHIISKIQDTIS